MISRTIYETDDVSFSELQTKLTARGDQNWFLTVAFPDYDSLPAKIVMIWSKSVVEHTTRGDFSGSGDFGT